MKKTLSLFFALIISQLIGCASGQVVMRDRQTNLSEFDNFSHNVFKANWNIAEEISKQDAIAWVASDSILSKLSEANLRKIDGYIANGDFNNGSVVFFDIENNDKIKNVATVKFMGNKLKYGLDGNEQTDSVFIYSAKALLRSREINKKYMAKQNANYNEYVVLNNGRIFIYMMPANTDRFMVMGGGIKSEFDKDRLVRNTELHLSIIPFEISEISDINARSSSVTDVPNEIDIAQYLMNCKKMYNQMIRAKKYTVLFYFIPQEDRIAVTAIKN